jgi:hypothetical protein
MKANNEQIGMFLSEEMKYRLNPPLYAKLRIPFYGKITRVDQCPIANTTGQLKPARHIVKRSTEKTRQRR